MSSFRQILGIKSERMVNEFLETWVIRLLTERKVRISGKLRDLICDYYNICD